MNNKFKKSLSLLVALSMIATLIVITPMTASAGYTSTSSLPSSGGTLYDGYVYNVTSNISRSGGTGGSALSVQSGATVVINIASGCTLTVTGGNGSGSTPGGAGIYVPSNSTLIITGGGTLNATGGDSGTGSNGSSGASASYGGSDSGSYRGITFYSGNGGSGGYGAGGPGAGIGTRGGYGGSGGSGGSGRAVSFETDSIGYSGNGGSTGGSSPTSGTVYILGNVSVNASAGYRYATGGSGGSYGSSKAWYHEGWGKWQSVASGAGGGGGGYSGTANSIGAGGAGGGGGGGGGGGSAYYIQSSSAYFGFPYGGSGASGASSGSRPSISSSYTYTGIPGRSWSTNKYSASYSASGGSSGGTGSRGSRGSIYKASTAYSSAGYDYSTSTHSAVQYTVSFNRQSGSGGTSSTTATLNTSMPSISVPTRTGHTFGGYYTGTGGSGTRYYYANGTSYNNWAATQDTTLYAKWTVNSYTTNVYGSTGGTASGGGTRNYNSSFTITATPNTGYQFTNWSDGNTSASRTVYQAAGTQSFTAYFSAIPAATAPFTTDPVSLNSVPYAYSGRTMTIAATESSDHTYAYQWYQTTTNTNSGGTAISGATEKTLNIPTGKVPGTYYFYCRQTATRKGSGTSAWKNSGVASLNVVNASQNAPSVGYSQETLFEKNDGTITGVTTAMEYRAEDGTYATCPNGTITNLPAGKYYVRYKAKTYYNAGEEQEIVINDGKKPKVKFNLNNPMVEKQRPTYVEELADLKYGDVITTTDAGGPLATTGFIFMGWYKDPECTIPWNFEEKVSLMSRSISLMSVETPDVVDKAEINLYAKWEGIPIQVNLAEDGSTGGDVGAVVYGDLLEESIIEAPTKDGYTFGGYYNSDMSVQYFDREGNRVFNEAWNIPDDTTMYAYWLEQGSELNSISLNFGGTTYTGIIGTRTYNEETGEVLSEGNSVDEGTIELDQKLAPLTDVSQGVATFDYKPYPNTDETTRATTRIYRDADGTDLTSGETEFNYSRSEYGITVTSEDGLNTTSYALKFEYEGGVQYGLKTVAIEDTDRHYNPGDTLKVNILATSPVDTSFGSYQFDLDYDNTKLELTGITTALAGSLETNLEIGRAAFTQNAAGAPIAVSKDTGTVIATATFTVNHDIETSQTTVTTKSGEITMQGFDSNPTPLTYVSDTVDLHNIKLTFNHDAGITPFETATAYVRYNEANLYTSDYYNAAFTYPGVSVLNTDYRLHHTTDYWKNVENEITTYYNNTGITARGHLDDASYTATSVELARITVNTGANGGFANFTAGTVLTLDKDIHLSEAGLPNVEATGTNPKIVPNTGYAFVGWKLNDSDTIIAPTDLATTTLDADMTLTAMFEALKFDWKSPDCTNTTVVATEGVTDGKVTYGVPVKFTVTADESCIITGVTYTITDAEGLISSGTCTLTEGVYEVPGNVILGDVTVEANALEYRIITFAAGEGNTLTEKTAYVVTGTSTMYASLESLKTQGASDFTIPVPQAEEGYRLRYDNSPEEALWTDGTNHYQTGSLNTTQTFDENKTLTARSMKQWTVNFAAAENGALNEGSVTEIIVDDNSALTAAQIPSYTPKAGYVFDKWNDGVIDFVTIVGEVITEDITYTVSFKHGTYNISWPGESWITVNDKTGVTVGEQDTVIHGTDVTFTVLNTDDENHRIDKVFYKIGDGAEVEITADVDGKYTIPGNSIIAPVTVYVESTGLFPVTFIAGENGSITGTAVVNVGENEYLTAEQLAAALPVGNTGYKFLKWIDNGGNDVTPTEVEITEATQFTAVFELASRSVTMVTDGVVPTYTEGYSDDDAQYGTDIVFTVASESKIITGITYSVNVPNNDAGSTEGTGWSEKVAITPDANGVYTIPGAAVTGNIKLYAADATFDGTMEFILRAEYKAVVDENLGRKILVLNTAKQDGKKYVLANGTQLYWSSRYNAYVAWVEDSATAQTLSPGLALADGAALEINYNGDINGNGTVTAADAGIISDCLHDERVVATSALQLFKLDVAGDGTGPYDGLDNGWKYVSTEDITWTLQK